MGHLRLPDRLSRAHPQPGGSACLSGGLAWALSAGRALAPVAFKINLEPLERKEQEPGLGRGLAELRSWAHCSTRCCPGQPRGPAPCGVGVRASACLIRQLPRAWRSQRPVGACDGGWLKAAVPRPCLPSCLSAQEPRPRSVRRLSPGRALSYFWEAFQTGNCGGQVNTHLHPCTCQSEPLAVCASAFQGENVAVSPALSSSLVPPSLPLP